jgi:hypothetical protein
MAVSAAAGKARPGAGGRKPGTNIEGVRVRRVHLLGLNMSA